MKRKTLLTIVQYIVFLGLGIALIYHMFSKMSAAEKSDMIHSMEQIRLWYLVPILIIGLLSHIFRALRWKLLLDPLHIRPTTANTTFAVLIGYLVNLLVPRMGEIAKCTVLAKYEKVPPDKMIGTIVAERTFDVVILVVITLLAFVTQADIIGSYATKLLGAVAAKQTLLYIGIAGLVFMVAMLVVIYKKFPGSKVGKFIKGLGDGVKSILVMEKRGQFLIYTVLIWGMYWLQAVIGFLSLPATEHLPLLAALVVLVFGSVGMIATPGGVGAYPLLLSQILVLYGLKETDGSAFGWVSWSVQTGVIILLGIISLILLPIYNRKEHNAQVGMDTK
jgi:uncharacterized protein (TIRG00374 family)